MATSGYLVFVRTVGLKVLKNKLAEYVRLAEGGERVLISDRDRVVAELVPPDPGRAEHVADAVLAGLVRDGLVTPPLWPGRPPAKQHPRGERLRDLLAGIDADRAERGEGAGTSPVPGGAAGGTDENAGRRPSRRRGGRR